VDDVMFSYNKAYVEYGDAFIRPRDVNQRKAMQGRTFSASAPFLSATSLGRKPHCAQWTLAVEANSA